MSYEEYINYLIRTKDNNKITSKNHIELQKIKRKKAIHTLDKYKIIFSYNEYNHSDHFQFDIEIEMVRKKGTPIPVHQFLEEHNMNNSSLKTEFSVYFKLLEYAIQKELEPIFTHKGRFEDHYSWKKEFQNLGLPSSSFEEDVAVKLHNYQKGLHYDH